MKEFTVRRFEEKDAPAISALIAKTTYTTNSIVYDLPFIDNFLEWVTPEKILERAEQTHYYVICDGDTVVCSGAIGPYMGREDESILLNIYLLPEYHGMGLGKRMVDALEQDEYFLRAKRVFLHAALNAVKFYKKLGYDHVNGEFAIDEDHTYWMEKRR